VPAAVAVTCLHLLDITLRLDVCCCDDRCTGIPRRRAHAKYYQHWHQRLRQGEYTMLEQIQSIGYLFTAVVAEHVICDVDLRIRQCADASLLVDHADVLIGWYAGQSSKPSERAYVTRPGSWC
jgi:hypothetical protein